MDQTSGIVPLVTERDKEHERVLQTARDGLSVVEAADRIGVTRATIHRWISEGHLPVTRFGPDGRIIRIHPDDLDDLRRPG